MQVPRNTVIAIIGLGYVGMPLAVEFGKIYPTIGFDINAQRIAELRQGVDLTLEVSREELAAADRLVFSTEPQDLRRASVYIVTVPTPIDRHKQPDLTPLKRASETVAKVLKLLAQAGLVESFRGATGGYRLARPPSQIPLLAVVEALEGPLGMTACSVHDGDCGIESHCGIRAGWQRINDVVVDALKRTTLADMLVPAAAAPNNPKAIPAALVPST